MGHFRRFLEELKELVSEVVKYIFVLRILFLLSFLRPVSFTLNTKDLALHRIWYPAGFFLLFRSLNYVLCEWFLSLRDSVFFDLISTRQVLNLRFLLLSWWFCLGEKHWNIGLNSTISVTCYSPCTDFTTKTSGYLVVFYCMAGLRRIFS